MRDYAELILDLRRHHCDAKEDDTQEVCEECAYDVIVADKSKFNGITDVCTCGLMHRAADAIEELLAAANSVVKCKDCKWWSKQEASIQGRCARLAIYPTGEFYCASGSKEEPPKGGNHDN